MYTYKFITSKKGPVLLFSCLFCSFCSVKAIAHNVTAKNTAIEEARMNTYSKKRLLLDDSLPAFNKRDPSQGWEVLFNGQNTSKWRGVNSDSFPSAGWLIKDGALFLNKPGAGDIVTREMYSNFELELDFNLTESANSGIKYFVGNIKDKKTGKVAINGPEYQIIDNYNHPEVKDHKHDIAATASCYLLYEPKNIKLYPAGKWNHVRIIARGKHVEHWLNGIKVLSYERGSDDFRKRKSTTKFSDYEQYGELPGGYILLTDHNDKVYFKNIRIKRL